MGFATNSYSETTAITSLEGIENWDTSLVTDMSYMFYHYTMESLNLSNCDTSKVSSMAFMFAGAKELTTITYGPKFIYNGTTDIGSMFIEFGPEVDGCRANKPDHESWKNVDFGW